MTTEGVKATEKSKEEVAPAPKVAKAATAAPVLAQVQKPILPPDDIVVPGIPDELVKELSEKESPDNLNITSATNTKLVYVKTLDGKYKTYPTIAAAIKYSRDESVLRVKGTVNEAVTITGGRTLTIDLEGHVWNSPTVPLTVYGADVTIRNGSITAIGNNHAIIIGEDKENDKEVKLRSYVNLVAEDQDGPNRIAVNSANMSAIDLRCGGVLTSQALISSGVAAIDSSLGAHKNTGAECYILGGSVSTVAENTSHAIDWHQGSLYISGGVVDSPKTDTIEFDAGSFTMSGGIVSSGAMTAILLSPKTGLGSAVAKLTISGGEIEGKVGCINQTSGVQGKNYTIDVIGGKFTTTGTVFTAIDAKQFARGTSVVFSKTVDAKFIAPNYVIKSKTVKDPNSEEEKTITIYVLVFNDWVATDGGAVGGGFIGYQRLLIKKSEIEYATGGITVPLQGLYPAMIVSVTAKNGLTAWYDRENNKFVLYRGGVEVPNTTKLEDFAMLLIGN